MQIHRLRATELMTPLATNAPSASTANSSTSSSQASTSGVIGGTDALGNESTFLQLLVSQIKNQDPTAPMDSTTFLTQLAQFSSLEQLIGIRQDVAKLDPPVATTPATSPPSSTPGA